MILIVVKSVQSEWLNHVSYYSFVDPRVDDGNPHVWMRIRDNFFVQRERSHHLYWTHTGKEKGGRTVKKLKHCIQRGGWRCAEGFTCKNNKNDPAGGQYDGWSCCMKVWIDVHDGFIVESIHCIIFVLLREQLYVSKWGWGGSEKRNTLSLEKVWQEGHFFGLLADYMATITLYRIW